MFTHAPAQLFLKQSLKCKIALFWYEGVLAIAALGSVLGKATAETPSYQTWTRLDDLTFEAPITPAYPDSVPPHQVA